MKKIIDEIKEENKKLDKLEDDVVNELKGYASDVMEENTDLYDEKPFVPKVVFVLVGITNFLVGYALYFLIKDDKKKKWQASYLVKGATIGLVGSIVIITIDFIAEVIMSLPK